MFLEDSADTSPLLNFNGTGNRLNIEGTVVMDKYGTGRGTYANIHVPEGSELTIGGAGTLYFYKTSGGAGSGGASEGTEVYFRGGSVNIHTDYSGSSVGGGGYDAGNDSSGGSVFINPTGGIVGSNEVSITNCYNMGPISATSTRYAMAIGTNNGGGSDVRNCYWLTGSAPCGGYYGNMSDKTQVMPDRKLRQRSDYLLHQRQQHPDRRSGRRHGDPQLRARHPRLLQLGRRHGLLRRSGRCRRHCGQYAGLCRARKRL